MAEMSSRASWGKRQAPEVEVPSVMTTREALFGVTKKLKSDGTHQTDSLAKNR